MINKTCKQLSFVFLFSFFIGYAQDPVVDSLQGVIQNTQMHDTIKLNALAELHDLTFYLSPEAKMYNNRLGTIASQKLRQKDLNPMVRTIYLKYLAMYYSNLGTFEQNAKATVYFDKSIQINKSIGMDEMAYGTLITKAGNYAAIGDNYNAIQCFFQALKYFEQKKDQENIPYILYQLAGVYHNLKNDQEAIKYYKKAFSYMKKLPSNANNVALYSTVNTNMGTSYLALKKYSHADFHFNEALSIAKKNKDTFSTGIILTKIGLVQQKLGNLAAAFSLYQQGATLSSNSISEANVQMRFGEFYYLTKKYRDAEKALTKAYDISAQMGNEIFLAEASNLLHKVCKENGNYPKAYEMLLIYNQINDADKVAMARNSLVEQELKHDFEKKEWNHQLETERKNNLLIGLSGAFLLLFLAVYFLYRNNKQKQRIATFEKNELKQKLLLSQMNPHFIFNSIDNIKSLIYNKKDEQAVNYLTRFSKLTRQILENSNEGYISLQEEVKMLENYLVIQQLLYSNRFTFAIDVDATIDQELVYVPPMLTQPFVENAIKHGLKNKQENGQVDIRFYKNQAQLFFEVTDNGNGFDPAEKKSNQKSLAVAMTRERLINYTKKKNFELSLENIIDKEQRVVGAKINFEIPYIYEN